MSTLSCPHCDSRDRLPLVQIFLDVGLDRPPRPWALDGDEQLDPAAIGFRCANGCVGITAAGQLVPTLGGSQRAGGGRPWRRPPVEHNRHDKKSVEARACLDRLGT